MSTRPPTYFGFRSLPLRVAVIAVLLAAAGSAIAFAFIPRGRAAPDFTLTADGGTPFTLSQQRGKMVVLFFGYTHCPDVCPTTLSALAHARRKIGDAAAVRVVLVTVDRRRDTPAELQRYVRLFDPTFVGLTGSTAQLNQVYTEYHVYHQDLPSTGSAAGYAVAHSSTIYFIGPQGRVRGTGDWSDSPDELATAMKRALS